MAPTRPTAATRPAATAAPTAAATSLLEQAAARASATAVLPSPVVPSGTRLEGAGLPSVPGATEPGVPARAPATGPTALAAVPSGAPAAAVPKAVHSTAKSRHRGSARGELDRVRSPGAQRAPGERKNALSEIARPASGAHASTAPHSFLPQLHLPRLAPAAGLKTPRLGPPSVRTELGAPPPKASTARAAATSSGTRTCVEGPSHPATRRASAPYTVLQVGGPRAFVKGPSARS